MPIMRGMRTPSGESKEQQEEQCEPEGFQFLPGI
jgi:hypothetical protein